MEKVPRRIKHSHGKQVDSQLKSNGRAHSSPFYLHVAYPLNTIFHFVTFLLLFITPPFSLQLHPSVLSFDRRRTDAFNNRWNLIKHSNNNTNNNNNNNNNINDNNYNYESSLFKR